MGTPPLKMEDWSVTIEKVKAICEDGDSQEALGLLEKLITLSLDLNVRYVNA